ncbi:hypothetical protein [Pseudochelatococcus sp. G4_1912]|uniref:hypothetical protein n=1 Tax=Pseudochelatococcus sp. G4_1912 TaxID=3114288 RepID=UPI0039C74756
MAGSEISGVQGGAAPSSVFATVTDSIGSFCGKTVRVLKDAGQGFCNLVSRLWDKITSFFSAITPSGEEMRTAIRDIGPGLGNMWRDLKRSVSDFFNPPTVFESAGRGISDEARDLFRL